MNEKTGILRVFDVSELQLAQIRSLLNGMEYIEIGSTFYVTGNDRSLKKFVTDIRKDRALNYIFVFIDSIKDGCWVSTRGVNQSDVAALRRIINANYSYP